MSAEELMRRATARLAEAERIQDIEPLLGESALTDALSLLSTAAPAPDVIVQFAPLVVACWTYWYRSGAGERNPEADQDAMLALALRNILRPLLPDPGVLPVLPPDIAEVELDVPTRVSGFACVMSTACGRLAGQAIQRDARSEARALFDQGTVWLLDAYAVMPEDHEGFGDVSTSITALRMQRFEALAEPEALLGAAEFAVRACDLVSPDHPRQGPLLPAMLDVAVRAALLLGTPELPEIERLLGRPGISPTPETAGTIAELRELHRVLPHGPGEFDAVMGGQLCANAVEHQVPAVLACGAVRLRAALSALPEDHPDRGSLIAALHTAYSVLGWDTSELPGSRHGLSALIDTAVAQYSGLLLRKTGHWTGEASTLLDRILDLAEESAFRQGLPGLPADLRAAIAFADCLTDLSSKDPRDRPLERIDRYRRAWDMLTEDHTERPAYGVMLAASALQRAEAAGAGASQASVELSALAAEVTAELAAGAPTGFEPLSWLRTGHVQAAKVGALSTLAGATWSAEAAHALDLLGSEGLRDLAELVTEVAVSVQRGIGGDLEGFKAVISLTERGDGEKPSVRKAVQDTRTVLDRLGSHDRLSDAGGELLSTVLRVHGMRNIDAGTISEAVELLGQVHEQSTQPSAAVTSGLQELLTTLAMITGDPAHVLEAAAVQEAASASDPATPSAQAAFHRARVTLQTRLHSYFLTHDQDQLERARRSLPPLIELGERADAEQGPGVHQHRIFGEHLRNVIDLMGPGGSPVTDTTDEVLERCRRTYHAASSGELRAITGMILMRALTQRSKALYEADPERWARLLDEADTVADALLQEDTPVSAGVVVSRAIIGLQRKNAGQPTDPRSLLPASLSRGPHPETVLGLLDEMAAHLQPPGAVGGGNSGDTKLPGPHVSLSIRAHFGISAAAGAVNDMAQELDVALSLGAETVGLLRKLTDRGGPQHAAEHGLLGFEGHIRGLTTQIVQRMLIIRNLPPTASLQERAETVQELVTRVAASAGPGWDDPSRLVIRTVSGPQVEATVALHESGRGLLLARRLESRTDLGALTGAHPALASRFLQLTGQLETGTGGDSDQARLEGLRASRDLDQVIEQIRTRPGFEDFQGSPSPERLRELASDGPIVVLNHAPNMSCIAFVVTPQEMTAVLLDVMARDVTDAARRLGRAIESIYARGSRRPPPGELAAAREAIRQLLAWTWHSVVEPVLAQLHLSGSAPPGADWPRIWWVPTGAFNALPLHAAQCLRGDCEGGPCGSALDSVVSSFIPGFQTLAYAREQAAHRHDPTPERSLVVSESDDVLPGAVAAARLAADALTEARAAPDLLVGELATRAAVLAALETSPWVQFGCHAHSSPEQPAGSWIQLPSGESLSVLDICRIRPDSARLAVLTACGTARASERLTDEAVHVSSAFILAGYPQAVGTLWEVESTQIGHFLRGFYSRALADDSSAALALHHTVRELRGQSPDQPHIWAAYIHAGA